MTVQSPPSYLQNGSHSAAVFRQAVAATWQEGGPVQPNELWVAAQSTPNMSVQVGAGRAVVTGTQVSAPGLLPSGTGIFTSQAMYTALNDAAVTLTVAASDPTNPRIDVVYVGVQDSFYSGATNLALVGVVTGTPAASPVAPAAPANAEVLATVSVAANATTVTNGNITNKISPATPIGQPVTVDTYAHLLLWTPLVAGTYADVNADATTTLRGLYRWSGTAWAAMVRWGTWTWSRASAADGNVYSDSTITAVPANTTDTSFVISSTGTAFTLAAGLYEFHFMMKLGVASSGRTLVEVQYGGNAVARVAIPVGEDTLSVDCVEYVAGNTVVTLDFLKTSGGSASPTGRIVITKLA